MCAIGGSGKRLRFGKDIGVRVLQTHKLTYVCKTFIKSG